MDPSDDSDDELSEFEKKVLTYEPLVNPVRVAPEGEPPYLPNELWIHILSFMEDKEPFRNACGLFRRIFEATIPFERACPRGDTCIFAREVFPGNMLFYLLFEEDRCAETISTVLVDEHTLYLQVKFNYVYHSAGYSNAEEKIVQTFLLQHASTICIKRDFHLKLTQALQNVSNITPPSGTNFVKPILAFLSGVNNSRKMTIQKLRNIALLPTKIVGCHLQTIYSQEVNFSTFFTPFVAPSERETKPVTFFLNKFNNPTNKMLFEE